MHNVFQSNYSSIIDPKRVLEHATNPMFQHVCCFVESCRSTYWIANGCSNLDIIQHVIIVHTNMDKRVKEEMLMGTRRR